MVTSKRWPATQVDEIVDQVVYQYSLNPGVTLSVVGSGGNLSAISDTRLQAGAQLVQQHFLVRQQQQKPSTVTVNYQRLNSTNETSDTNC